MPSTLPPIAAFEARLLSRSGGLLVGASAILAAVVAFAQETAGLRRSGLGFAWGSTADLLVVTGAIVALLWILRSRPPATNWQLRLARKRLPFVLGQSLGLFGFAGVCIVLTVLASLTVESISVGRADLGAAAAATLRGAGATLPIAAIAPAVAHGLERPVARLAAWLAILLGSAGIAGIGIPIPLDRLLEPREPGKLIGADQLLAVLLATAAGVMLSSTLVKPRTCASASSATSTATSRP